jgi:Trk-type K+ transport system membrane component
VTQLGEKLSAPLVAILLVLILATVVVLTKGHVTMTGNEVTFDRAVFQACNAGTLTGLQLATNVNDYQPRGQYWIFALIVFSSLVSLLVGGWALVRILRLPFTDLQVLNATLVLYLLLLVIGANFLIEEGGDIFSALFNAASAFGNAGQWVRHLPEFTSWRTHLVLLPLAFLGGLSVPVILDVVTCPFAPRAPHPHTFAVLCGSAILFIVSVGLIFMFEWLDSVETRTAIQLAATESMNTRTLGMPFTTFTLLARPAQWFALLLMLIGAAPAGTGGGLKLTTPLVLFRDSIRALRGMEVSPALGVAVLWMLAYLLVVFVTTVALVLIYPQVQSDRLLFLAVSAVGNVGSSQEPITLTGNGLFVLSFAMLFGRLAPLAVLWWMAYATPGEVDVAVG